MEDDKMDIGNAMDKKAIPNKEEREKVIKATQDPLIKSDNKNNSATDGLNQAKTPNNDLEPGF